MRILIQKFGGTSVATDDARACAAQKVLAAREAGYTPVVVVSAMGRKGAPYATDTLIQLVKTCNPNVSARELDQIMYCGEIISAVIMSATLSAMGIPSVTLTGGQAGIITDDNFSNARIVKVQTASLKSLITQGIVPVVCGFQGVTAEGAHTTLGRGGSDTTAAALGNALDAEKIEIYTDVAGIMTADPKLVSEARLLNVTTYQEVCQMAEQGAKVIHPRAVEIAMQKNIPLVIRSTFSDEAGTLITSHTIGLETNIEDQTVTSVAYVANLAQIKLVSESDPLIAAHIFRKLGEGGISADMINVCADQIQFTVPDTHAEKAMALLAAFSCRLSTEADCAKVTIVGGGMRGVPGVMANFMEALQEESVEVLQTVDSHTTISALIKTADLAKAVTVLHKKFKLSL
ncbi:MAG: aspartate kinase [Selenomonadales bacterium]|nr:aspartate kinase [Selenomonadales bacterium]